jgi:flavodoxin
MSGLEKAVAEVAAKYTKTDLARAALTIARDNSDWKLVACISLLLNIWLAHLAGVL